MLPEEEIIIIDEVIKKENLVLANTAQAQSTSDQTRKRKLSSI